MTERSHYDVLGVARSSSARDIRRAYHALALRYHPDIYSGPDVGSRFREITDAYEVLKDPVRRARYDAMSRPAPHRNDRAPAWAIRRRSRDVPRFLDDTEAWRPVAGDLIDALLREMLADVPAVRMHARVRPGAPSVSRPSWRTEVWRWP